MAKQTGIGNPALVSAVLSTKQGQQAIDKAVDQAITSISLAKKVRRVALIAVGTGILAYGSYKGIQYARRQSLMNKSATDPHVKSAIDIYTAIPEGYKNKWKAINLNPFANLTNAYAEIETLWKSANTERIMQVAKRIYNNKLKFRKVSKYFKIIYHLDLMKMLNKVLTTDQIDVFSNYVTRGTGSETSKQQAGNVAIAKMAVHLRSEPNKPGFAEKDNVVYTIQAGKVAGQITGNEETFVDGTKSTVFVEIMAYDSSVNSKKYSTPVWAWKNGFLYMSKQEAINKYGSLRVEDIKKTDTDSFINDTYNFLRNLNPF
ncbi:MAG: hypothetical protein PHE56_08200 [Bacteroidales bacterium]|nr:hypothetical protein [Bacteroidales bacterium]